MPAGRFYVTIRQMAQNFHIELENFKGPLHILLELIEKHKLPINEVSLSKITDEFLKKASEFAMSKSDYSEFIFISSTLMLIKSKSLLPVEERSEEEEEASQELQMRLKALQILKNEAAKSKAKFKKVQLFRKSDSKIKYKITLKYARPEKFIEKIEDYKEAILSKIPNFSEKIKIVRRKIRSLEEVLKDIERKLNEYVKISFNELNIKNKEDKLVTFLAILELRRKGKIQVVQKENDIHIEQENIDAPYYG